MDKDEARRMADELLEKERQTNAQELGRRVPFFIRSAASRRLGRQREWELFRQARSNVFANKSTSVAMLAAPVALGLLFVFFAHRPFNVPYVAAWIIAVLFPQWLFVAHLRRELARLARAEPDRCQGS
jgi:Flp pilus assembly protein TadB